MATYRKASVPTPSLPEDKVGHSSEGGGTSQECMERALLQEQLESERSLSTRLMRIIIRERSTVSRIYDLLAEQRPTPPRHPTLGETEDKEPGQWEVCGQCRARMETGGFANVK